MKAFLISGTLVLGFWLALHARQHWDLQHCHSLKLLGRDLPMPAQIELHYATLTSSLAIE